MKETIGRTLFFFCSFVISTNCFHFHTVIDLYGGDQKQDRLLFLAPSTGRNATLLGEISGE